MKLFAITRRGLKRDFIDLYYLLKEFSMDDLIVLFRSKFPNIEPLLMLRSLTWFDDAEQEPDQVTFEKLDWEDVKKTIVKACKCKLI